MVLTSQAGAVICSRMLFNRELSIGIVVYLLKRIPTAIGKETHEPPYIICL